jgi:alginate O-acetyltransferase complex protein AlgI
LEAVHYLQNKTNVTLILAQKPALLRWSVYYLFLISIVVFGEFSQRQFIYFQF